MKELGWTGRDTITGFTGVVTARAEYISGCHQVLLSPTVNDKGEHREPHWYDEQRVQRMGNLTVILDNGATPGCDIPAPKR